jgi:hypothetical protein
MNKASVRKFYEESWQVYANQQPQSTMSSARLRSSVCVSATPDPMWASYSGCPQPVVRSPWKG